MNPMDHIWEQVAGLASDGERTIVYRDVHDLKYLYASGFVDTSKFTLVEWIRAFSDSQRKDGSYRLTYTQWMAKQKFRFDPESPRTPTKDLAGSYERLKAMTTTAKAASSPVPAGSQITVSMRETQAFRRIPQSTRI